MIAKLRKLSGILSVSLWRSTLLRHHVAAGVEHTRVLRDFRSVHTVVDIGANRGQFALAARRFFPDARIHAFEPLARPAERFRRVFAGDPRVTLHMVAIGPERREAAIHIARRDDSSSLLPITARQNALFPGTAEATTTKATVAPLNELMRIDQIETPSLLKVDVQGYELEALRGCESFLHRFAYIYCECSFVELYEGQALADEVIAWLRERGLKLRGVHNTNYDRKGRAIQADFLFSRQ